MNPLQAWKELVYYLYITHGKNPEDYDLSHSCIWEDSELTLLDIGYSKGGINKRTKWFDTYISLEEVEKFKRRVEIIKEKKKDFIALFRFGSKEKRTTNKVGDFCLIAATFRFQKGVLKKVNIFYRTTEIITKFLADLILLNDIFKTVLKCVNINGIEVEFFFTKVYTRYFHLITFYRVCMKLWKEDVTKKLGVWAKDFINNVKSGKREFKFCAAKRLKKSFMEDCNET